MATLKISLLGIPKIEVLGQGELALNNRKAIALLAYLVMGRHNAHNRESLLAMFWPNLPEANARNNLRVIWSHLSSMLGKDSADEPYLIATRRELQFNPRSQVLLDVAEYEEVILQCEKHTAHENRQTCLICHKHLLRLAELYRGEFLAGLSLDDCATFDEWQFVQRERMHVRTLYALDDLAVYFEHKGEYDRAEDYARRQIELDPLRERAHRQLMQLLVKRGQRTGALAQFETYKSILSKELGVQPEAETLVLYQNIKDREMLSGASRASQSPIRGAPLATDWLLPRNTRNLPETTTPFVGREDELDQLILRMREGEYRLFSIVGFGGIGKTRLAIQLTRLMVKHYSDGACFVSLASLQYPSEIPSALWAALNIGTPNTTQQSGASLWAQTLAALRKKHILIVFDNFDHLLKVSDKNDGSQALELSAVSYLLELLQHTPSVYLLVTTRVQLNLQAEDVLRLSGLEFPNLVQNLDINRIEKYASVRLFCNRAYRINKSFKLTEHNLNAVAQICHQVQGNPLAIELAASWLSVLTCEELVTALKHNLDLLSTNMRDVPLSHRSMRAVFNHSWSMLSPAEGQLLKQLGVFHGGFMMAAATAVAEASPINLTQLLHKSLLQTDGIGRYRLHEVVSQFVLEMLSKEENRHIQFDMQLRHCRYFLQFVVDHAPNLYGRYPHKTQQDIYADLDNIRAAWLWAVAHHEFQYISASVDGLNQFFTLSGLNSEAELAFAFALKQTPDAEQYYSLRLRLLLALGNANCRQSKLADAMRDAQTVIQLAQQIGDKRSEAYGELIISRVHFDRHELIPARASIERSLHLANSLDDLALQGVVLLHYGRLLLFWEEFALSEAALYKAYEIEHMLGNVTQEQMILVYLGSSEVEHGNIEQGWAHLQAALALNPQTRFPAIESRAENVLGYIEARAGNLEIALVHHQRSQQLAHIIGELVQESHALINLCSVCRKLNQLDQAEAYGREALQIAIESQSADAQAFAYLHLGYLYLALNQIDKAYVVFVGTKEEWRKANRGAMQVECQVGLAEIAYRRGNMDEAIALIEQALIFYGQTGFNACDEPLEMYRTCHRVLTAAGDSRASQFVALLQRGNLSLSKK